MKNIYTQSYLKLLKESVVDGIIKRGVVVFLNSYGGSKSEGLLPYLYESADSCVRIMLEGDNPFENKGLLKYDGKQVEITCTSGRGNILIVHDINDGESPSIVSTKEIPEMPIEEI